MARARLGIDLGTRSIKVALAEGDRIVKISTFEDLSRLDPGPGENPVLLSWLDLFVRENRLAGVPAVTGFPGERLAIVGARVPAGARRADLRGTLAAMPSFRRELPFADPAIEVFEEGPLVDGFRQIFIAAASRSAIESRAEAIRRVGLVPAAVEIELAAIARVLETPAGAGRVILDIGEESTQLGLALDGRLVHLTTIGIGAGAAVGRLAAEGGIDEDAAAARLIAARSPGADDPLVEEILEPIHRRLRGDLARCLAVQGKRLGFPEDRKVVAIGGGAQILPIDALLAETGLPREPLQLDPAVILPEGMATGEATAREIERTCLAVGMALRKDREPGTVTFLGPVKSAGASAPASPGAWIRHPLTVPGLALAFFLAIHFGLDARVDGLEKARAEAGVRAAARQMADRGSTLLQERLDEAERTIEAAEASRAAFPAAIVEVGRASGPAIKVSSLEARPAGAESGTLRFAVTATARSSREAREFASRLAGSPLFKGIELKEPEGGDGNRGRIEFVIQGEIAPAAKEEKP